MNRKMRDKSIKSNFIIRDWLHTTLSNNNIIMLVRSVSKFKIEVVE
jgi:hypothetical protein